MKKICLLLAAALLLTGCSSVFDGQYYRISPHIIQSGNTASEANTAENAEELREILAGCVLSGMENVVIYSETMDFDGLEKAILSASRYVRINDPVGAYTVDELGYQIGMNSGRTAVAVEITYRHGVPDMRKVPRIATMDNVSRMVLAALDNCDARSVMLIGKYENTDFTQMVWDLAQQNPQTVMEIPQVTEQVYGNGDSRVVELTYTYENSRDLLRQMQNQVRPIFDAAALYVTGEGSDNQKYAQLYAFLMERFDYLRETSITPTYSLLRHGVGDSRAFATVYAAMCRRAGLECRTVTGTRDGESRTWNMICDEGRYYHVDLLRCLDGGGFWENTDSGMVGYVWDYDAYPECNDAVPAEEVPEEAETDG